MRVSVTGIVEVFQMRTGAFALTFRTIGLIAVCPHGAPGHSVMFDGGG